MVHVCITPPNKPTSRLFSNVSQEDWKRAFDLLQSMRSMYPTYRDDDLLMHLLVQQWYGYARAT